MEEKSLKVAAVFLAVLTILVCIALPYLPGVHTRAVEAREDRLAEEEYAANQVEMQDLEIREANGADSQRGQLSIRLPEGVDGSLVEISNDYVTQTVRVEIPGTDLTYFDSYPIAGSSSYVDMLSYARHQDEGIIEIVTDQVYELETYYDENFYYFNFLTPQEV